MRAVLDMWEAQGTEAVIAGVDRAGDSPEARLRDLMVRAFTTSLSFDNFESQLRAWAQKDDEAAEVVARVDDKRRRYVAALLTEAGIERKRARHRAELLYRLLVGDFTMRAYGDKALPKAALEELLDLLVARR
ncbi:MAG: hypothetical protein AAGA56_09320 [Myxococcota bacterium]